MFVLPIVWSYVRHWGTWECIREIVQNAIDEEQENGHKMAVKYERGWLRVSNHGADLQRNALLIGKTSKANRADLRGQFGEGLDLALLVGVRAGYQVKVYTKTEIWTPSIEHVKKFDEQVLVVRTSTRKVEGSGVEVRVKMPLKDWLEARKLFRFLVDDEEDQQVHVKDGTILLHPDREGQVYVQGIYSSTVPKLSYGYDLHSAKLDRDRKITDMWDLRWKLAAMLREAVAKDPERLAPAVYKMLKAKTDDVQHLEYNSSDDFAESMAAEFKAEHGEEAIPVEGMAESQQLDHLGAQGVVVSDTLKKVLERKVKSASEVKRELATAAQAEYSWQDLEDEERAILDRLVGLIHEVTADWRGSWNLKPLLDRLHVVDFKKPGLEGTCERATGTVKIARRLLADEEDTLIVLVHEEAHALSAASDGAKQHLDMIERIWARLYFAEPATS
jgi:hypothetical protein